MVIMLENTESICLPAFAPVVKAKAPFIKAWIEIGPGNEGRADVL